MTQEEDGQRWAKELVARVGRAIKAGRGGRSAAWLSDRTAELGYRVSPTVIAKLDTGHRGSVLSVPELIVLAAALNTSPVNLVYPGPYDAEVEVVPGSENRPQFEAAQWFSGYDTYIRGDELFEDRRDEWEEWQRNTEALDQWRELNQLIALRDNMDNLEHIVALNGQIKSISERLGRIPGAVAKKRAIKTRVESDVEIRLDDE